MDVGTSTKKQNLSVLLDTGSFELWVNPDCGLKTRGWKETLEQLQVMMNVTHKLRAELAK